MQVNLLNRDVYINPPREAGCPSTHTWNLNKCMYGLCDASLKWYSRVCEFVAKNNGKISKFDPALFMWHDKNNIIGLIAVHVDDFLCTGENSFLESILTKLQKSFSVGKEEQKCFRFLGLNVQSKPNETVLDQNHYICNISKTLLSPSRKNDSLKLNENEKKALQEK